MIQGVTKTVKNKVKDEIGEFLGIFEIALWASLLGIVLAEKGVLRGRNDVIWAEKEMSWAGKSF